MGARLCAVGARRVLSAAESGFAAESPRAESGIALTIFFCARRSIFPRSIV